MKRTLAIILITVFLLIGLSSCTAGGTATQDADDLLPSSTPVPTPTPASTPALEVKTGYIKEKPYVVSVDGLVAEIEADFEAAMLTYNGMWVQIGGKVINAYNVAGMTCYYLYGDRGETGLRIICWCDEEIAKPFEARGDTMMFLGEMREVTPSGATEIGNCEILMSIDPSKYQTSAGT